MAQEIKLSDWLCIAQEGKTIDGREIKRDWIESVAKTYSADLYQALIWCEHEDPIWRQWSANLGTVEELKTEEKDGKLRLLARLRANSILQTMNEQEQKIYSSIEIMPDFPEEGDHYLVGLAATDQPSSTGLSRLAFSKEGDKKSFRADPVLLCCAESAEGKKSMFDFLKFNKKVSLSMTQEQIDALIAELEEAKTKNAELQAKVEELQTQLNAGDTSGAQQTADEIQAQAEATGGAIDNAGDKVEDAEFSKLKQENIELQKRFNELEQKFSAAINTPVTPTPGISSQPSKFEFH